MEQRYQISLYAPNFINICIDDSMNGELSGRIYHCYSNDSWQFTNILRLLEAMDNFFDQINFPQAATSTRVFSQLPNPVTDNLEKVVTPEQIAENRGKRGTFFLNVKYRQNSSWQGIVHWIEGNTTKRFISVLELLKIINNSLSQTI